MPISRHTFTHLDTDTDQSVRQANSFDAALNIALEPGYVTAQTGNVLVPYFLPPTGTNKVLGAIADGATGTAIELLYNSADAHRLVRYDPQGSGGRGSRTTLLEWSGLSLSADLVVQGEVVDGLLVYLGADGYLRCVNLARATAGYYTPTLLAADPYTLHLVKRPPTTAKPLAFRQQGMGTDSREQLRIIQNKAYQFAVRWNRIDGEQTVLSPYSEWVDILEEPSTTLLNTIFVTLPPAPLGVSEVEVLVREPDSEGWQVAETLRADSVGQLPNNYTFYGVVSGVGVTTAEASRLFEAEWPGKVAVVARSRPFKADLNEGYVTPQPAFTASISTAASSPANLTLHENSTYRVGVQFYDAQGKPGGVSKEVSVYVPKRAKGNTALRSLNVLLTTTDPVALNAEIPAWADSYQFLVARNDRTTYFLQGQAADCFGYLGHTITIKEDGTRVESEKLVDIINEPHQKIWVDIGNFPAAGVGYVWQPGSGDILRFLNEDKEYVITNQIGDYLEVQSMDSLLQSVDGTGQTIARIEIYSPNTSPSAIFYERGQRLAITRAQTPTGEQRGYSAASLTLEGDCYLVTLNFPRLDKGQGQDNDENYQPPNKKSWLSADQGWRITVESMVPPHRLVPATTPSQTIYEKREKGGFFSNLFSNPLNLLIPPLGIYSSIDYLASDAPKTPANSTTINVNPGRTAANFTWLDMSYGGRPGVQVPTQLQQVRRAKTIRFGGVKVAGTQLNGLSRWEALSQYDELPAEQGAITRLTVADQTQTDGSILLANQERGDESLSLGQSKIQTADDQVLLAISRQVIGGNNTLRGGYGCTDPASVVSYAGKVFFWCARRAELLRYDRNGLTPLGEEYKAGQRLSAVAKLYVGAKVSGCFHPRRERKEYWLTFHPVGDLPGVTLVYSERSKAWVDAVSALPEAGCAFDAELLTWQGGALWRHTPDAPAATFYGQYTPPTLTFSVAQPGGVSKEFKDVAIESPSLWLPTNIGLDTNLFSRTYTAWFTYREGVWRTGLRRASNSPGFPSLAHALNNGRPLIGTRLTHTLTAPENAGPLTAVSTSFTPRSGQKMSN